MKEQRVGTQKVTNNIYCLWGPVLGARNLVNFKVVM